MVCIVRPVQPTITATANFSPTTLGRIVKQSQVSYQALASRRPISGSDSSSVCATTKIDQVGPLTNFLLLKQFLIALRLKSASAFWMGSIKQASTSS